MKQLRLRLIKPKLNERPTRRDRKDLKKAALFSRTVLEKGSAEFHMDSIKHRFTWRALKAWVAEGFLKFAQSKFNDRRMSVLEQAIRVQGHVVNKILEYMDLSSEMKSKAMRLQHQLTVLVSPITELKVGELKTILGISERLIQDYGVPVLADFPSR